jgi:NAD(P)-dependent dehydrogenase (short-subunit alcohol dehydrogenase family)
MALSIDGTVIVTGGASGLGEAVAKALKNAGARPVVMDLREPTFEVDHVCVDMADTRRTEQVVRETAERHGGLFAVVTAAGTDACGRLDAIDAERWERVIKVNLLGGVAVVRAALPYLEKSRGRVVTVSSTLGIKAVSDATAYCASKFGMVGFTSALAAETAGRIGVTLLIPGGMATHFFDGREEKYKPGPDARLNRPEDVAQSVIFALAQPAGCEVRELVVCSSTETSWP